MVLRIVPLFHLGVLDAKLQIESHPRIGLRGREALRMKALILFLAFCCLTLPSWSQATFTSSEEETWLLPRPVKAFQKEQAPFRNPKMLLEFLRRVHPEVKVRAAGSDPEHLAGGATARTSRRIRSSSERGQATDALKSSASATAKLRMSAC